MLKRDAVDTIEYLGNVYEWGAGGAATFTL
jgi:hypothetical protein